MSQTKFKPVAEQLEYLKKGIAEIIREDEFVSKLRRSHDTGKPLRAKLGVDPTAPDIHLGHMVVIEKLRQFQILGHKAVFLVGDFTEKRISIRSSRFSTPRRRRSATTASGWTN